jgi:hypothetical protein
MNTTSKPVLVLAALLSATIFPCFLVCFVLCSFYHLSPSFFRLFNCQRRCTPLPTSRVFKLTAPASLYLILCSPNRLHWPSRQVLTLYWLDLTTQGEGISLFTSESVYLDGYLLAYRKQKCEIRNNGRHWPADPFVFSPSLCRQKSALSRLPHRRSPLIMWMGAVWWSRTKLIVLFPYFFLFCPVFLSFFGVQ